MPYIFAALGIAALAVLAGLIVFYMKPQRESLNKHIAELDAERGRLNGQAETRQKELLIEAREEALRLRTEVETDNKDKRAELLRVERKLAQKEEVLDDKLSGLEDQREALALQERAAQQHLQEAWNLKEQQRVELSRIAGLSAEEARSVLMKEVENQARHDLARLVMQIENEARAVANLPVRLVANQ